MSDQAQGQQPLAQGLAAQGQYPYPHADEAPPPQPSGQMPDRPANPLAHLDTAYLSRVQKDLRSHIPSDPTFMAHVSAILRALIQHSLSDPARVEADKAAAEAAIQQQRDAQVAALPPDDPTAAARLKAQHDRADLAIEQARERADFDARQAEARAQIVDPEVPLPEQSAPLAGN